MPLGRGLESLIPPIGNNKPGQRDSFSDNPSRRNAGGTDKESAGGTRLSAENFGTAGFSETKNKQEIDRETFSNKKFADSIFMLEVEKIKPNPLQPRRTFDEEALRELSASIREHGVIQPLIVSKIEQEIDNGTIVEYQLIAGERRLIASKMAGLERVPAIIRHIGKDIENLELAIIENLQRSDLNPIEAARAYARLQDEFRLTQREIAVKMSKSREAIANALRLLNLPSDIQESIEQGKMSESQARLLLAVPDLAEQRRLFLELTEHKLSVRDLKSKISRSSGTKISAGDTGVDPELSDLEERLSAYFGTKVKIERSEKGGKIVINFYSPEEITGIIEKIKPGSQPL